MLTDVSLSFMPGAKIGVLGYNGAGKSTLLRIMAGLDTDFDGHAQLAPKSTVGPLSQSPRCAPCPRFCLDVAPNVLGGIEQRGLARVLRVEGEQHHQSRRVTRMARLAVAEHGADWVINNDADEFWWPAIGSLADVFAAIPDQYGQIEACRNNFLPRPNSVERPFHQALVVRDRSRAT